jgi:hypothetical protein
MGPNTANKFDRHPTRHKFYEAGIASRDGTRHANDTRMPFQSLYNIPSNYKTITLQTLMSTMGTDHLDVVRMDCEGAEWQVLEAWLADGLLPKIDQLLLEIHMDREHLKEQLNTITRLLQHENVVWSQRNPYAGSNIKGTVLRPVWELGLWNRAWNPPKRSS